MVRATVVFDSPWRTSTSRVTSVAPSRQLLHERLELAQVAALVDAVGVHAVLADDRVARVPVAARLGVQPVDVAGLVAHLPDDPALRGVVVVPRVAEQEDR